MKFYSTAFRILNLLLFLDSAAAVEYHINYVGRNSGKCPPQDIECDSLAAERARYHVAMFPEQPKYFDLTQDNENRLMRYDPGLDLFTNNVHCWPSSGGFIIAQNVHVVELEYIGLGRLHITPRSFNTTEEDAFCMKLRKIGGKWWDSYYDWEWTTWLKYRRKWPDEREVLLLGWPEKGGVWVLRFESKDKIRGHHGPIWKALTMEERCQALEAAGAIFYENPEESELVAPLLGGFGEREKRGDPPIEIGEY